MSLKFIQIGKCHAKNEQAFKRGCELFNIQYEFVDSIENIRDADLIWSPTLWFEPSLFPNSKILYGPQFFVFPSKDHPSCGSLYPNTENRLYFTGLSDWISKLFSEFVESLKVPFIALPFGVDTNKFKPDDTEKTIDFLIYFKHRHSSCANKLLNTVEGFNYKVIAYGSYTEDEYIDTLKKSKFCIWVGCHESQGFALQECLSMNVPIFLWNVTSMKDEYVNGDRQYYRAYTQNLYATSAPYWDDRCGKIWNGNDMKFEIEEFTKGNYNPREFVLETLSDEVCFKRLLTTFKML